MSAEADRMKAEMTLYSLASVLMASAGPAVGIPEEQQIYLWSVSGTVIGAAIASAEMPTGTTHSQRAMRAFVSVCAGLILAPYAIAYVPRPDELPVWWHAFAASGIAAAIAYIIVTEAPRMVRQKLRGPQSETGQRGRKTDREQQP
jgi:hypothetical protein